ncbi:MAG: SDR family NAD(P)-dependent oxidoreductase [Patescibacteria group bacterium]
MKCLVTGGAGFIGSHLVDKLIEKKYKVVVVDDLSAGKKENLNQKAVFYKVDICDFEKIKPLFKGVDFVFHLAAIPKVSSSVEDPAGTSKINILGTINVFKAALDNGVKRVVFASSSAVYGNQKKLPLKEDLKLNPLSPYGLQKLTGEQFAKLFTDLYKLPVVSLRYFNVYGPRIDFNSDYSLVIGKFLRQKAQKKPLTIFGLGNQTRAFCYVADVVSANIKAAESKKLKGGEIINIGQKKSFSINYLSRLVGGKVQHLQERAGDLVYSLSDISLAKKLLKWEPKYSLKQGLEETKKWFNTHKQ